MNDMLRIPRKLAHTVMDLFIVFTCLKKAFIVKENVSESSKTVASIGAILLHQGGSGRVVKVVKVVS